MSYLVALEKYVKEGAKAATSLITALRDDAVQCGKAVTSEDALILLTIHSLALHDTGRLDETAVRTATIRLESADVGIGTKVVHAILLGELARKAGVEVTFSKALQASGSDLDWDLIRALRGAAPEFTKNADLMIAANTFAQAKKN